MAKVAAVFLLLLIGYLFYPFWDLYVKHDPFAGRYQDASKGYWTRSACLEAAREQKVEIYRCHKRVNFNRFMGVSANYSGGRNND